LLSHQRANVNGITVDLSSAEARQRWQELRESGSPSMKSSESRVVDWHLRQLKDTFSERDWAGALVHSKQIVQIQPEQTDVWVDRGLAHAELNRWSSAADSFRRADTENVSIDFLCDYALIALACHDTLKYLGICKRLDDRVDQTLLEPSLSRVLLTCTMDPSARVLAHDLVEVALANPALDLDDPGASLAMAMTMFRVGRLEETLDLLQADNHVDGQERKPLPKADQLFRDILLVMVSNQLGDRTQNQRLEEIEFAMEASDTFDSWHQRLRTSLLLAEARQSIDVASR
jgi:hypothetical protein